MNAKLYSVACERNAQPILDVLERVLPQEARVLEIGSGTGQHAVFFGEHLPKVTWQTSDLPDYHPSIASWQAEAELSNVLPPILLDLRSPSWPACRYDAVFTANTFHIMAWQQVEALFTGLPQVLKPDGLLCVYGPFNYAGRFTSDSNARFDASLRAQFASQGIRDIEAVMALADARGLVLEDDVAMPANNRLLTWKLAKQEAAKPQKDA
jgi:cyclopropane fatty-acyl-phospholipid synthase-like methyltransferase